MRKLERREFFKHLSQTAAECFDTKRLFASEEPPKKSAWVKLVRFAEMPPGKSLPFAVAGVSGVLYSDAIGLRARLENGSCAAIRGTANGLIEVNVTEGWPPEHALSHATGSVVFSE